MNTQYDMVLTFIEGLAMIRLHNKYGFINEQGEEVVPPKYDYVGIFKEGLAKVKLNGKYGFINKKGIEVIPLMFDWAESFERDQLVLVERNLIGLYMDKDMNYYELETNATPKKLNCEECVCYNDKLTTNLCCKFRE